MNQTNLFNLVLLLLIGGLGYWFNGIAVNQASNTRDIQAIREQLSGMSSSDKAAQPLVAQQQAQIESQRGRVERLEVDVRLQNNQIEQAVALLREMKATLDSLAVKQIELREVVIRLEDQRNRQLYSVGGSKGR